MLPLSCPLGSNVSPSNPSQKPESHFNWTGLGHMANAESTKGLGTLMEESISLEPHGSPDRILGTGRRRKWTIDAGKASKKCSL